MMSINQNLSLQAKFFRAHFGHGDSAAFGSIGLHQSNKSFHDFETSSFTFGKYLSELLQLFQIRLHQERPFAVFECRSQRKRGKSREQELIFRRDILPLTIDQPCVSVNRQRSFNLIKERWIGITHTLRQLDDRNIRFDRQQGGFHHFVHCLLEGFGKHVNFLAKNAYAYLDRAPTYAYAFITDDANCQVALGESK